MSNALAACWKARNKRDGVFQLSATYRVRDSFCNLNGGAGQGKNREARNRGLSSFSISQDLAASDGTVYNRPPNLPRGPHAASSGSDGSMPVRVLLTAPAITTIRIDHVQTGASMCPFHQHHTQPCYVLQDPSVTLMPSLPMQLSQNSMSLTLMPP